MDVNGIIDGLENKIMDTVSYMYLERVKKLSLEISKLITNELSNTNMFDNSIKRDIMDAREQIQSNSNIKQDGYDTLQPTLTSRDPNAAAFSNTAGYEEDFSRGQDSESFEEDVHDDEGIPNLQGFDDGKRSSFSSFNGKSQTDYNPPLGGTDMTGSSNVYARDNMQPSPITPMNRMEKIDTVDALGDSSAIYDDTFDDLAMTKEKMGYRANAGNDYGMNASPFKRSSVPYQYGNTATKPLIQTAQFNANNNPQPMQQPSKVFKMEKGTTHDTIDEFTTTCQILANGMNLKTYNCKSCEYTCTYNSSIHSHIRRKHIPLK